MTFSLWSKAHALEQLHALSDDEKHTKQLQRGTPYGEAVMSQL